MSDALSYSYLPKSTLPNDISDGLKELYVANTYLEQKKAAEIDDTKKALTVSNQSWNIDQQNISDRTNGFVAKTADAMKQYGTYSFAKLPIDVQQKLNAEKNAIEYDAKSSLDQKKFYDKSVEFLNEHADKYDVKASMENLTKGYLNKEIGKRQADQYFVPKQTFKSSLELMTDKLKGIKSVTNENPTGITSVGGRDFRTSKETTIEKTDKDFDNGVNAILSNNDDNASVTQERYKQASLAEQQQLGSGKAILDMTNKEYLESLRPSFVKTSTKRKEVPLAQMEKTQWGNGFYQNEKSELIPQKVYAPRINPDGTVNPNSKDVTVVGKVSILDRNGKVAPTLNMTDPMLETIPMTAKYSLPIRNKVNEYLQNNRGGQFKVVEPYLETTLQKDGNWHTDLKGKIRIPNPNYIKDSSGELTKDEAYYFDVRRSYNPNVASAIQDNTGFTPEQQVEVIEASKKKTGKYGEPTQQKGTIQPKSKSGIKWEIISQTN